MGNPMRIRATAQDGVTEVRVLMPHVMETGLRKDAAGAPIPTHFITELSVRHNDRVVLDAQFGPAVSANPYLAFSTIATESGMIEFAWIDDQGGIYSAAAKIQVT